LIPTNIKDFHWVLNVIDLKNKKISFYDSLVKFNEKNNFEMLSNITKFFDDFLNNKSSESHNINLIADITSDRIDEDTTNTNKVNFNINHRKNHFVV